MTYISGKFESYRGINLLAKKISEIKKKGIPYLDLTVSNPTIAGLSYPENEIKFALTRNEIFKYYPSPKGLISARNAISKYYSERGKEVQPANLYLTAGTSEAVSHLIKLFCNVGDEILIQAPGYPLYDFIANLESVVAIKYHLKRKELSPNSFSYSFDFDELEAKRSKKTKICIVVQPNNPIGKNLNQKEADRILEFCKKYKIILLIDEVFADYTFNHKYIHFNSQDTPVITMSGFSKVLGLPQLKLSWMYLEGNKKFQEEAGQALEIITDTYLSVNTQVMVGASELLSLREKIQDQILSRIEHNLTLLEEMIRNQKNVSYIKPDGGWYIVLFFQTDFTDEEFCLNLLSQKSVYVHPGYMFEFSNEGCYIVISLITSTEVFIEGLRRIAEFIETL